MKKTLDLCIIEARDLPDLWFQAVYSVLEKGRRFVVDQGSFAGQTRLEFDYFIGHVTYPGTKPMLPEIPAHIGIPNPVDHDYVYGGPGYERSYIEYLMSPVRQPGEGYTYGRRLTAALPDFWIKEFAGCNLGELIYLPRLDGKILFGDSYGGLLVNQIEWVIDTYKKGGHRNNQMVLQVAQPSDIMLKDPPCLRHIDTRIQDGALHFFVYFRSWDLWAGLPANLAAIQHLKEYMAAEIGVEDGEMIVESKGLHLYGYAERLAELRCMKEAACTQGLDRPA